MEYSGLKVAVKPPPLSWMQWSTTASQSILATNDTARSRTRYPQSNHLRQTRGYFSVPPCPLMVKEPKDTSKSRLLANGDVLRWIDE